MSVRALVPLLLLASGPPRPGEAEAEVARVRSLAGELAALGVELDARALRIEVRAPGACRADVDRQQDHLFAPGHFDAARVLLGSLGMDGGLSADELRAVAVEATLDTLRAYYQADRGALVLVERAGAVGAEAGEERDRAWLHELAHAWQDRAGGAAGPAAAPGTLERARLLQTVREGHADAVALGVLLARRERELGELDQEDGQEHLAALRVGPAPALPYRHGLALALDAFDRGGWEAVHGLLRAPPASTEQVLHPEKRDDEPTRVRLPLAGELTARAGATRREDTVGELALLSLFLEAGLGWEPAHRAAAGWDGDRLVVLRLPAATEGDDATPGTVEGLAWRSVWDREEDAAQFAEALGALFVGRLRRDGRVVDAAWSADAELERRLTEQLAATPQEELPPAADAESAAALDRDLRAARSVREAQRWLLPRHGLRVPIPEGWELREVRGVPALKRVAPLASGPPGATAGFDDNITVTAARTGDGHTLDELRARNERGLAAVDYLTADGSSSVRLGDRDAFLLRYHGRPPGAVAELSFASLSFLRGGELVTVTGTARRDRWPRVGPTILAALRGVVVEED